MDCRCRGVFANICFGLRRGSAQGSWRPSGLVESAQRRERERTNLFTPASRRPSSSIPAGPAIPLATQWEFVSLARLSEPSPCSSKVSLEVAALGLAAEDGDLLSMGPSGRNGVRNVLFSGRLLLARPLVGESADPWRPLDERTPQVKSRLHLRLKRAVDHIAENRVDLRPFKNEDNFSRRQVGSMAVEATLADVEGRPLGEQFRRFWLATVPQAGNERDTFHDRLSKVTVVLSSVVGPSSVVGRWTGTRSTGREERSRVSRTTGARPPDSSCDHPSAMMAQSHSSATWAMSSPLRPTRVSNLIFPIPHGQ